MTTRIMDIPLSKLAPSDRNVRRTGRDIGIDALATSIGAHGLLQNLTVVASHRRDGRETGKFEVVAGGRRLAALKALAAAKAIAKDAAISCVVRENDGAEEVSLAENVVRENLHPADQFDAFRTLADEQGLGVEEIAARFGVTPLIVRQRLRLATVNPALVQVYRDGGMSLDQLIAFTATEDQARQLEVWEGHSWNKEPAIIRRALNEGRVSARDRRALFVGADAYEGAGGIIERDLFVADHGGQFTDPSLLDRLALQKLSDAAEGIRAEGWRWTSATLDLPTRHGCRRVYPRNCALPADEEARLAELSQAYDALEAEYEADEEVPEAISNELDALTAQIESLAARRLLYDPNEVARSGVFVTLDHDGAVRLHRGFVRPEDEPASEDAGDTAIAEGNSEGAAPTEPDNEDDGEPSPLSDRLVADLTAHRTAALRNEVAERPAVALLAVTHALTLRTFYSGGDLGSCLELKVASVDLTSHAPGIDDGAAGRKISERHAAWATRMPDDPRDAWDFIVQLTDAERGVLLAHCASLSVNALKTWERRTQALRHADQLAQATGLDMITYWTPTADSYFGRVTKAHMLAAVREVVSDEAARRIEGFKKPAMAAAVAEMVAGKGWLPPILRSPHTPTTPDVMLDVAAE